jgi:hypothetical protein
MTKDDIIRMAREAGFRARHIEIYGGDPVPFVAPASATDCMPELERFAAIVAAAERKACEKACAAIAIDRWNLYKGRHPYTGKEDGRADSFVQGESSGASDCVEAILARGDK